jgi:WD40 repeat protein
MIAADMAVSPDTGMVDLENPWPGLAAFREKDQPFFQGRKTETETLLRLVTRNRLTVLYGLAGQGKTSLLQAGLFPKLRDQNILPIYIRLDHSETADDLARQVLNSFRTEAQLRPKLQWPPIHEGESLWQYLHRSDADFWNEKILLQIPVLVIDQFEEIFTLGRNNPQVEKRSAAFLQELGDIIEGRTPESIKARLRLFPEAAEELSVSRHNYKILLSLREDYLPDLETLRPLVPSIAHHRWRLSRLTGEQAREVTTVGQHLIEPGVEQAIIRFVARAQEADNEAPLEGLKVEPALLSVVCRELNNKRRQKKLPLITADLLKGHQNEILRDYYERSTTGLRPQARAFLEDRLVNASGQREMLTWDALIKGPGLDQKAAMMLIDNRLLRIEDRDKVRRVELIHDLLTDVVRTSREARYQREIQSKLRKAQWLAGLFFALFAVTLAFGGFAHRLLKEKQTILTAREQALADSQAANNRARAALAKWDQREAETFFAERPASGLAYLARALRYGPDDSAVRSIGFSLLLQRRWHPALATLRHGSDVVYSGQISPDGTKAVTASWGGTALLWDTTTGKRTAAAPLEHQGKILAVTFSPDGKLVATGSIDGTARLWVAATGEPQGVLHHEGAVQSVQFNARGTRLITASTDTKARVWDVRTQRQVCPPLQHAGAVFSAQLSPDGRQVVTASSDWTARVWDAETGKFRSKMQHRGLVYSAQFSPDGQWVVSASQDGTARVWNVQTGRDRFSPPLRSIRGAGIRFARFSPDGRLVVTAAMDNTARLWNAESGRLNSTLQQHKGQVRSAQFSPDGRWVVTASTDGTARVWDVATGISDEPLTHDGWVYGAWFSSQNDKVLTVSEDGTARLWRNRTGTAAATSLPSGSKALAATFSLDGNTVLTTTADYTAQLWDARTGLPLVSFRGHERRINDAGLSADGSRVLTASSDRTARLWNARSGQLIGHPLVHPGPVLIARFGPSRLTTVTTDGTVRFWDLQKLSTRTVSPPLPGREVRSIELSRDGGHLAVATAKLFAEIDLKTERFTKAIPIADPLEKVWPSPDGVHVAIVQPDGKMHVRETATGRLIGAEMLHDSPITLVRFNPKGDRMATVSGIFVRLWETGTGKLSGLPLEYPATVAAVDFSRDGRRVAAATSDGRVYLTNAFTGKPIGSAMQAPPGPRGLVFSSDDQRLVVLSMDGTVRLLDTPTGSATDAETLASLLEMAGGVKAKDDALVLVENPGRLAEICRKSTKSETMARFV